MMALGQVLYTYSRIKGSDNIMIDNFFSINESFDFMLQQFGQDVKVNGEDKSVVIHRNNYRAIEELKILSHDPIIRGNLIQFDDNIYLVNDDTRNKRYNTYYRTVAQRCNYKVNFVVNGFIHNYPVIITTEKTGLNQEEIVVVPENKILVIVQANYITKQIKLDDEFIKFMRKYKITGTDWSKSGLITIYAEQTAVNESEDDLINEIPGGVGYKVEIEVSPNPLNITDVSQKVNVTVKENSVIVENPELEYISQDTNIATVGGDGIVTGISSGTTNITISYVGKDGNTYSKDVIVNVVKTDATKIVLYSGMDEFTVFGPIHTTITAKLIKNGVEDTTARFVFDIQERMEGKENISISIAARTDTTVTLKGNYPNYGTGTLIVWLATDNNVYIKQEIQYINS